MKIENNTNHSSLSTNDCVQWITLMQKEREILIEKIKWCSYIFSIFIIPTIILLIDIILNDWNPTLFPAVVGGVQILLVIILIAINVFGLPVFLILNYKRYISVERLVYKTINNEYIIKHGIDKKYCLETEYFLLK